LLPCVQCYDGSYFLIYVIYTCMTVVWLLVLCF
jgi:hypothetical protein